MKLDTKFANKLEKYFTSKMTLSLIGSVKHNNRPKSRRKFNFTLIQYVIIY